MKRSRSEEIAWAAGWFEGEGYFSMIRYQDRPWLRPRPYVGIVNCDLAMLEQFMSIVGYGSISGPRVRGTNKPLWTWQASGRVNVRGVYELLLPWLSDRRAMRGAELLEEADTEPRVARPRFTRRRLTKAHREKLAAAKRGRTLSAATRRKMRKSQQIRRQREASARA